MEPLFSRWNQVATRLRHARTIALFLDFDGTLAELHPQPLEVFLAAGARRDIAKLTRSPRFRVWVISGRKQADISARIHVPGIRYLGLHGWEGRSTKALPESTSIALANVKRSLTSTFQVPEGMWIEDKGATIAIHYRPPATRECVFSLLVDVLAGYAKFLRLVQAKNVWEIIPQEITDKGDAVRQQMATIRNATVPLYIGDDLIDEPAFRALPYGITVHVGRLRNSKAKYWLPGVVQVHELLRRLAIDFA